MEEKKETRQQMITISTSIRVELMKEFPVSEKTVTSALNFVTNSYTAAQIRRRDLELGVELWERKEQDTQDFN